MEHTRGILVESGQANVAQLLWGLSIFLRNLTQPPCDGVQSDLFSPVRSTTLQDSDSSTNAHPFSGHKQVIATIEILRPSSAGLGVTAYETVIVFGAVVSLLSMVSSTWDCMGPLLADTCDGMSVVLRLGTSLKIDFRRPRYNVSPKRQKFC